MRARARMCMHVRSYPKRKILRSLENPVTLESSYYVKDHCARVDTCWKDGIHVDKLLSVHRVRITRRMTRVTFENSM